MSVEAVKRDNPGACDAVQVRALASSWEPYPTKQYELTYF